ncbi:MULTISPECIES: hypothetical protein [Novosphingobium]|uniref:Uncharacterized protein n=1 Tax=Novosphingobium decolorationis TaxID=2698673 RepID=A0ABX8E003_9SPHN|nr:MULTISPECIES: hypothetical protein [Novosphingobium]MED5546516.1 hypothetical protein [Pseudomonadota bacterium]QVM82455.1 hypothetical protein HT578_00935 [Novosphingobium decolorationis]GAM06974.1 hypothetical conserved protein [Novosphingobium sp. MBES04]
MALIKAFFPAGLLTWVVAGILGSQGMRGGVLLLERASIDGHTFFWSWPLFLAATGLSWFVVAMLSD